MKTMSNAQKNVYNRSRFDKKKFIQYFVLGFDETK